jgi:hypothetical protein
MTAMNTSDLRGSSEPLSRHPEKKRYEKPVLVNFGDIGTLTNTVGKNGRSDGGKGSMSRSSP